METGATNMGTCSAKITDTKQNPDDEAYYMKNPNRGLALIFNHKDFESEYLRSRNGTEKDRDALELIFKKLKFAVQVHNDLNRLEIYKILDDVAKMDHSNNDCLVISVMSHGEKNGTIFAKDTDYNSNDLIEFFNGKKCPTLAGKPKLFFFQACRGDKFDEGVKLRYKLDEVDKISQNKITYSIPTMADILVMYATAEGFFSWRDTLEGSCFIQALVKQLDKHHDQRDLLSILTCVNRQVAIEFESQSYDKNYDKKKEMCSIVSMLTRLLYFH